jgi:NO-binding membrane sensor protein with MHYT domain
MHLVGMLAFRLPVPVRFDVPTVLFSLLAAILASAVALYFGSADLRSNVA